MQFVCDLCGWTVEEGSSAFLRGRGGSDVVCEALMVWAKERVHPMCGLFFFYHKRVSGLLWIDGVDGSCCCCLRERGGV